MKIAVSGCWHFCNRTEFAAINENGLNSRLASQIDVFRNMLKIAKSKDVELLILNGDLFQTFNRVDTDVMHVVSDVMAEASDQFNLIFNVGTHDVARRTGRYHALRAFQKLGTIVASPQVLQVQAGFHIAIIPHVRDSDILLKGLSDMSYQMRSKADHHIKILVGHFSVEGGIADNETTRLDGVPLRAIHADAYDYVFLNHFHKHQQIASNIMVVGSPMQHGFGEKATDKGFVIYDTTDKSVEFVELGAPLFLNASLTDLQTTDADVLKKNYFMVSATGPQEIVAANQLKDTGANIRIKQDIVVKTETSTDLDLGMSEQDTIKAFVAETCPEGMNKSFLTEIGQLLFAGESLTEDSV